MNRTVLVAHSDPARIESLILRMTDRGWHVLGPARTAAMALTLAGLTPAAVALVGPRLAAADGGRLLRALREIWGVTPLRIGDGAAAR